MKKILTMIFVMLLAVLLFSSNIKSNAKEDNYIVKASNSFDEENDYVFHGSTDDLLYESEIEECLKKKFTSTSYKYISYSEKSGSR